MFRTITLITLTILIHANFTLSQYSVTGTVVDTINTEPVALAEIQLFGTGIIVESNNEGSFNIGHLSGGIHTITVSKDGYRNSYVSFQIDSINNDLDLRIYLKPYSSVTDTIDVNAFNSRKKPDTHTSFLNVPGEEIRKSPGAMEDVIRYFTGSPGVSQGNDINNEIIIRGGSPVENLTLIDGLEIQNPNHYGVPGSTNGMLSYINLKMVDNVDFFSGGFPVKYGDKLSGVMDIRFKDGNRKKHIRDINISATGFGGFFEGPLTKKVSYMLSVRRSYLELFKDELTSALIPEYWDFNTKFSYALSSTDKISITGLFAIDDAEPYVETDFMYDTVRVKILSAGVNYSKSGSRFTYGLVAGYNWSFYNVNYNNFRIDVNDNELSLKQELKYVLNPDLHLSGYAGVKHYFSHYFIHHNLAYNASNFITPEVNVDTDVNTNKFFGGINLTALLFDKRVILNAGLRVDCFELINEKYSYSPRLGVTYKLSPGTTLNANAGIYFQSPEMLWVLADIDNRNLRHIRVEEIVLGAEHYFTSDIKISVEPYLKQYYNYPVSVYDPHFIFINSGVELYPNFLDRGRSEGKGYYAGVDVMIQKKNNNTGLFGSVVYSYSKSKFVALSGGIQPAEFDYGNQISMVLGYKLPFGLSISSRFKFAKGRPYTPFDEVKSFQYYRGIYDLSQYNKARMPDYSRLDIRIDQQFKIGKTNLQIYLEVINVLNRVNYYNYYWSHSRDKTRGLLQLPRIPVLGISVKF